MTNNRPITTTGNNFMVVGDVSIHSETQTLKEIKEVMLELLNEEIIKETLNGYQIRKAMGGVSPTNYAG
jgi:hypothetical protein